MADALPSSNPLHSDGAKNAVDSEAAPCPLDIGSTQNSTEHNFWRLAIGKSRFIRASYAVVVIVVIIIAVCLAVKLAEKNENDNMVDSTENGNGLAGWLHNITSVSDEDFSDLKPLGSVLESAGANIVYLGESTHGDGKTFLLKGRIVRYLHQELGFNTLVWETGMIDCYLANQQLLNLSSTDRTDEQVVQNIFRENFGLSPFWSNVTQTQPIFQYLANVSGSNHSMELVGFDIFGKGNSSPFEMYSGIKTFLDKALPPSVMPGQEYFDILQNVINILFLKPSAEEIVFFYETLNSTMANLTAEPSAPGVNRDIPDYPFWVQLYSNARSLADWQFNDPPSDIEGANIRDLQMANNTLWWSQSTNFTQGLKSGESKRRKMVVWTHNMHAARNLNVVVDPTISTCYGTDPCDMIPSGDHVKRALGSEVYSIGSTAHSGTSGYPDYYPLYYPVSPTGSLEASIHGYSFPVAAFGDLQNSSRPSWATGNLTTIALENYVEEYGDLSKIFDGILYFDVMDPITPITEF
jgi:erythromycin esterase